MNDAVNLALNAAGTVFLIFTGIALTFRNTGAKWKWQSIYLIVAMGLHFVCCLGMVRHGMEKLGYLEPWPSVLTNAFLTLFEGLSVVAATLCVFYDVDGRLRFRGRKRAVSLAQMCTGPVPVCLALLLERLLHEVALLSFAFTLTLYLLSMLLLRDEVKELRRREERLSLGQSKLLAEQMQPHLIFNALSTISALCVLDPEEAAHCVDEFSGYLRSNIDALTSDKPIPFRKELEHIEQYVALERADPARAFEIRYELETTDFTLPALTVQPIVENAIKHGALSHRDGSGRVLLKTELVGDLIRIVVEDNGSGLKMEEKKRDHASVGIENVRYRLNSQCRGTLNIRFSEQGTRAVITLPREGEEHDNADRG